MPLEIDARTAASLLASDPVPLLLDVREVSERQVCRIGEGLHIPTGEVPLKWESLPRDGRIIIYCHHGMRSLRVARFLQAQGFRNVQSLRGGIDAWSLEIDPSVPRY